MSLEYTTQSEMDFGDTDADTAAFLKDMGYSDTREPDEDEEDPKEGDSKSTEGDSEETSQESSGTESEADPNDAEVSFKIGDTDTKVRMSELRGLVERRAESERAFTETTAARAAYNEKVQSADLVLARAVEKAEAKWKPFQDIDWITVRTQLDDNAWNTLRTMAKDAQDEVKFFTEERGALLAQSREATAQDMQRQAQAAIAELTGPTERGGITGFDQKLYGEITDYAMGQGLPKEIVFGTVSPAAVRLLHKAMMFDRAQKSSATVAEKITKAVQKPTNTQRPASKGTPTSNSSSTKDALSKLAKSGSIDDAADAFMASFRSTDD